MIDAYVLLKDFDWFGITIKKGAVYKKYQSTADKYACHTIDGLQCPHLDLTFATVSNNEDWFLELNSVAINNAYRANI